jgi:hypothetical protein
MSLPIKKIYIDSQYRTSDSISTSSFKFPLARNMYFPKNTVFYIEDVVIPHSWTTIELGVNDTFYFNFIWTTLGVPGVLLAGTYKNVLQTVIPPSNYTGAQFAVALQTGINNAIANGPNFITNALAYPTVTYSSNINNITISLSSFLNTKMQIPNDYDLALVNKSGSCNNLIGNTGNLLNTYTSDIPFVGGMMNLDVFRNIYLSSPNLGTYTTLGSRGESNILKKIPVTSNYGYLIVDANTSNHDFLDCSDQTLNTIEFNLKDVTGTIIPLHGSNISFSIVFAAHNEDGL